MIAGLANFAARMHTHTQLLTDVKNGSIDLGITSPASCTSWLLVNACQI